RAPASPLFTTLARGRLDRDNIFKRVIRPAAEELGQPWVGWHTLRHTCASRLFRRGRNAKQVQRWLGHSSASFTLDTYVHMLEGGIGEGLPLPRSGHGDGQFIADQEIDGAC